MRGWWGGLRAPAHSSEAEFRERQLAACGQCTLRGAVESASFPDIKKKVSSRLLLKAGGPSRGPKLENESFALRITDFQWPDHDPFCFICNLQTGMLSHKMRTESCHSLRWFEPTTPQSRDLRSGNGTGAARRGLLGLERGVPGSYRTGWPIPVWSRKAKVDLSSSRWSTVRFVYIRHKHCATLLEHHLFQIF